MNFNPTWLYIKQHNRTGLKYFGKTVQDPYKYKGSGVRWLRHLSKHGDEVSTIWSQLFTDKESLTLFALEFSQKNNIVESKDWANLRPEDGLMGGDTGITLQGRQTLSEKSASRQHSKDTKEKIRQKRALQVIPLGRKLSEESKEKIRQKRALQVMPKGRVVSEETKKKISESQKIRMSKRKTL
jgi:NUMOD3 motif